MDLNYDFSSNLNGLIEKMKNVEKMVYQPGIYLSDYFYHLRNKIDIETETSILKYSNLNDKLNQIRGKMLKEIAKHEKVCLESYDQARRDSKIEENISEFYQKIQSLNESTNQSKNVKSILYELNHCKEINSFQFELLKERQLSFIPSIGNDVGSLFIFENERISDYEIERIM